MSNNNNKSGGVGFLGLLCLVFIVLKLTDNIDWSWWWVLCPLWGPVVLCLVGLAIYFPFWVKNKKDKEKRIAAGYSKHSWDNGGRSKWQQRLDEMNKQKK